MCPVVCTNWHYIKKKYITKKIQKDDCFCLFSAIVSLNFLLVSGSCIQTSKPSTHKGLSSFLFVSFSFQFTVQLTPVLLLLFSSLHRLLREILVRGKAQQPQEQHYHSYQSMQYCPMSKQRYGCECLGFLRAHRRWCMRFHTGVVRTPQETREHRLSLLREKSSATPGTQTHVSIAPDFSVGCSANWVIPLLAGYFTNWAIQPLNRWN